MVGSSNQRPGKNGGWGVARHMLGGWVSGAVGTVKNNWFIKVAKIFKINGCKKLGKLFKNFIRKWVWKI